MFDLGKVRELNFLPVFVYSFRFLRHMNTLALPSEETLVYLMHAV